MVEHAPEIYGASKISPAKQEYYEQNTIAVPQQSLGEDESLEKALDIIPEDYKSMTSMLSKHLMSKLMISVKDEEVLHTDDEEEKSSA